MLFAEVNPDIAALAEIVIFLLGALLIGFSLVLIYILAVIKPLHQEVSKGYRPLLAILLLFLLLGTAVYVAPAFPPDQLFSLAIGVAITGIVIAVMFLLGWVGVLIFCLFFLLWAATVFVAFTFAHNRFLMSAIVALVAGAAITTIFYFTCVRPLVRTDNNLIAMTMMVVGAIGFFTILALVLLWFARDTVKFDRTASLEITALVQAAGVIISAIGIAFTYLMRSEQANRTANQQIYQTLELQSIELFRFEADHPDLVEKLWFGPVPAALTEDVQLPSREAAELYVLRQYVCQMLNLFEMATRFRARGIMEPEVFGSWVIWMWELCESEVFCAFWTHEDGLPANYVKPLSSAMTFGVRLRLEQPDLPPDERKARFFDNLAKNLDCPEIKEWLKSDPWQPAPLRA